eukprot:jgi/Ulvmu1/9779/UM056_0019.1
MDMLQGSACDRTLPVVFFSRLHAHKTDPANFRSYRRPQPRTSKRIYRQGHSRLHPPTYMLRTLRKGSLRCLSTQVSADEFCRAILQSAMVASCGDLATMLKTVAMEDAPTPGDVELEAMSSEVQHLTW